MEIKCLPKQRNLNEADQLGRELENKYLENA
jgi:hypothetical protein